MCTVVAFVKNTLFFGRNMDIEYDFGQKIVVMPREFAIQTKRAGVLLKHYAMTGAARVEDGCPLYAEACNEKGLCMAGLNFPVNAVYADEAEYGRTPLAPYELIPYILGKCASLKEAKELLNGIEIIGERFKPSLPLAPLHWIVSDKSGSIVAERTADGLKIYENHYGVLTNNPPFDKQTEYAQKFKALSPENPQDYFGSREGKEYTCEGIGAKGLPGDFSSQSRFVKAAFLKENAICGEEPRQCVSQVFRMLEGVAMVRGSVVTKSGLPDITLYSCCIDAQSGTYYYRTYDSFAVNEVRSDDYDINGDKLTVKDMV